MSQALASVRPKTAPDHEILRNAYLPVLQSTFKEEKERIAGLHASGARGLHLVREISSATDSLIHALWTELAVFFPDEADSCALFALGGYGRSELNPYSDIDLSLIYTHQRTKEKNRLFEGILYSLWDLGFTVGHSSRTPAECVELAASDISVKTSLIESRFLEGSQEVSRKLQQATATEIIPRRVEQYIRQKVSEQHERHRKFGGSVYLREPHIKEGEGGLRDFHTALWIAIVRFRANNIRELRDQGIISDKEMSTFSHSLNFMLRVRNELHYLVGKRHDILSFDLQEQVAADLGYGGARHHLPVEHFMRNFYNHARHIKMFSEMIIGRAMEEAGNARFSLSRAGRLLLGDGKRSLGEGLVAIGRTICLSEEGRGDFGEDPADFMRPFYHACRMGYRVSDLTVTLTKQRIRGKADAFRKSTEAGRMFMQILGSHQKVGDTLAEMYDKRILQRYIPEFGALRSLVQHDLYHKYTVDHHTLLAIETMEKLRYNKYPKLEFLAELMREVKQPGLLVLGILLHDIGKSKGRGHAATGAVMARDICGRIGLSVEETETVVFLVENHLVMAHLAQRRELSDRKIIRKFAELVLTGERLRMLYILTYADLTAVGPNVWNDWKASLLEDCYRRTSSFLQGVVPDREYEEAQSAKIRDEVRAVAPAEIAPDVLEEFFSNISDRYFLAAPVSQILEHVSLVRRVRGEGIVVQLSPANESGYAEISICTYDAPGLFSKVAGVLASRGLNIMGARIFTRNDGILIDTFQFADPNALMSDGVTYGELERDLHQVITGRMSVEKLLSRRHFSQSRNHRDIPPKVIIDNDTSDAFTILEVYARDRIGLLYTITTALYRAGVYINSAKISTEIDQALDVFYVTDIFRHKINQEEKLEKIRRIVLDALA